jgi:hypothetical protein
MCSPNLEYQFVNPTTQVALFSYCIADCHSLINVTWNMFQGIMNASNSIVAWTPFALANTSHDHRFFGNSTLHPPQSHSLHLSVSGIDTTNFTATNRLFLDNPTVLYWRFEAVYALSSETTSSALNFVINQPPRNGSCSMAPSNGTTSTLFNVLCPDWFDEDGIKDYSLYGKHRIR